MSAPTMFPKGVFWFCYIVVMYTILKKNEGKAEKLRRFTEFSCVRNDRRVDYSCREFLNGH